MFYRFAYRTLDTYTYDTSDPVYVDVPQFSHWLYKQVAFDTSSYKGFDPVTATGTSKQTAETAAAEKFLELNA